MTMVSTDRDLLADRLFERFRSCGDREALGLLFDGVAPELLDMARTLTPDEAGAEDAVQETFLAAIESAGRFDPGRPVIPWLVGILRHKAGTLRRRRSLPDPDRLPERHPGPDPGVEAEDRERRDRVREILERLPQGIRTTALLRWRRGLEPAEIARLTRERPGTVRVRLHRALRRIRREMRSLPLLGFLGRGRRGLPAVRRAVIREGVGGAAVPVAVWAGAAAAFGGALMTKSSLTVTSLVLLSLGAGWWARGTIEPRPAAPLPESAEATGSGPRPGPSEGTAGEPAASPDAAGSSASTGSVPAARDLPDPWEEAGRSPPPGETPGDMVERVFGPDLDRARSLLPGLLSRALGAYDDTRVSRFLLLMDTTETPELRALLLRTMETPFSEYELPHADDRFLELLGDDPDPEVGASALRKLRTEMAAGEFNPGSLGGFAVLAGRARSPGARALFLELLEGKRDSGWQGRSLGMTGLAATGDPEALRGLLLRLQPDEAVIRTFLDSRGPDGYADLRRLALDPELPPGKASPVTAILGRHGTNEDVRTFEELWSRGRREDAMAGFLSLRPDGVDPATLESARTIVYGLIGDPGADRSLRRSAFYAVEYSKAFQTDRARILLEGIAAAERDPYWTKASGDALRSTLKALRRQEVREDR